jgi:hypothetical protein
MVMTTRMIVLIGAKEQQDLYPIMHGLLTYGKGIIVLTVARIKATITMLTFSLPKSEWATCSFFILLSLF